VAFDGDYFVIYQKTSQISEYSYARNRSNIVVSTIGLQ